MQWLFLLAPIRPMNAEYISDQYQGGKDPFSFSKGPKKKVKKKGTHYCQ